MKKTLLIILDGWGIGPDPSKSAIAQANTPFIDSLYKEVPNAQLITYGEEVGLPEGQMGNSEVGHLNIGAGRIVYQELLRINNEIRSGAFAGEAAIQDLVNYCKKNNKPAHIMGLLSDGGVHSHIDHLFAAIDVLDEAGVEVFIHCFLDGRDTDPNGGLEYLKALLNHIEGKNARLATVIGRYYAMDRDQRWERIAEAYHLMVHGEGEKVKDPIAALEESYENSITDEFVKPLVMVDDKGEAIGKIKDGDGCFFVNFRTDRPRQITSALTQKSFEAEKMHPLDLFMVTMTRYDHSFEGIHVVYDKEDLTQTLGEHLAAKGKTQLRIAETEKYPHVTFFFSGGREDPFDGESRLLIHSPKVATYDLQPEMSAEGIADGAVRQIKDEAPDFICLNFANADMVGHTGDFGAAEKAAEVVDHMTRRVCDVALKHGYAVLIIADHGNSDYMINEDGTPNTAHTKNPVPIFYLDKSPDFKKIKDGKLGDVAPTILTLMGLDIPEKMTGNVLVE